MKKLLVLTSMIIFTLSTSAGSKPKYLLKEEGLDDTNIYVSFSLQATDGSMKTFHPNAVHEASLLQTLPAEQGADYSLCQNMNIDLFLKLTEIVIRLSDHAINNTQGQLTADEVAIIKKSPRCDPYDKSLLTIASMLTISNRPESEELKKFSIIKLNDVHYVELKTEKEASIYLRITSALPKKVKEISHLSNLSLAVDNSGQSLSLQVAYVDSHYDDSPTRDYRTESCTITREIRTCDNQGRCQTRTITEQGTRYVRTKTSLDTETYEVKLVDAQNRVLFTGRIIDGDFFTLDGHASRCH